MITRRKSRQIKIGTVAVGGDAPITVQSMTKTDTRDVQATLLEIWSLEAAGCDIVRCAVPVREAAEKLGDLPLTTQQLDPGRLESTLVRGLADQPERVGQEPGEPLRQLSALRDLDEARERLFFGEREVREDLAIERDARRLEPRD